MPQVRPTSGPGAFTLLELLVVIVIIGLLVGLGSTGLSYALMAGDRAACASNMRQIGVGLQLYAQDNNGRLPQTSHGTSADKSWIYTLQPYLGNFDTVRICPADPKKAKRLANDGTSYTLNSLIFVPKMDPFGQPIGEALNHVSRIRKPTETMLAFIVSDAREVGVSSDHTHSEGWTSWSRVIADIQPDRHRAGASASDHSEGSANYLFADGHVETIKAETIKARVDAGINVAQP